MGFENGHKKVGGRVRGTSNQITRELRDVLRLIITDELESLPNTLRTIKSSEKRLELVIKLLPFVVPRAQEISLEMLPDSSLNSILESLKDEENREN